MNKDSKQLSCLNHAYIHNPSLINSGRVIKALRSLEPNSIEKQKIDFTIYKYLQKHILSLSPCKKKKPMFILRSKSSHFYTCICNF